MSRLPFPNRNFDTRRTRSKSSLTFSCKESPVHRFPILCLTKSSPPSNVFPPRFPWRTFYPSPLPLDRTPTTPRSTSRPTSPRPRRRNPNDRTSRTEDGSPYRFRVSCRPKTWSQSQNHCRPRPGHNYRRKYGIAAANN